MSTNSKDKSLTTRGFSFTVTVRTHSVGPPVTAYDTPASTGNATPPLKSASVIPVTGPSNVAVMPITLFVVAPPVVPDADVIVGFGG